LRVKQSAVNELIYIAPTIAFHIAHASNRDGGSGILGKEIFKSAELLGGTNETIPVSIRKLFKE
jgi:hypothetical protein